MANAKKLPSGQWRTLVYSHTEIVDGKPKRKYESFTADTKKESEFLAAQFAKNKENYAQSNITLSQAFKSYIQNKKNILSPSTISGYEKIVRTTMLNIQPLKINTLTNKTIQAEFNKMALSLSPKSLSNAKGLLSATLKTYRPDFMLNISIPAAHKKMRELPLPEDIFKAVEGSEIELPVLLAMWLGLRRSEIFALKKSDFKSGYVTIDKTMLLVDGETVLRNTTKTYGSTRKLKVPQYILSLIDKLNIGDDDFVCTMTPPSLYGKYRRILAKHNIQHISFHDLRHMNASIMLSLGVPDKYAMERGGWSSNKVLQSVYQHTYTDTRILIDDKIDNYFLNIATRNATQ